MGLFNEMSNDEKEIMMKGVNVGSKGGVSGVGGRKGECLGLLMVGKWSISELGEKIGISSRNVSCLFSYLRKDGYELREMKNGLGGNDYILWSVIREGVRVKGKMEVGEKGSVVKFDVFEGCFEDEKVVIDEVKEVKDSKKK